MTDSFEASPMDPDLGPCCVCRKGGAEDVRVTNIMLLRMKGRESGKGWGCVVCGLSCDGAVAVLCDSCAGAGIEPREVCVGHPHEGRRRPIADLTEPHEHDPAKHPEMEAAP